MPCTRLGVELIKVNKKVPHLKNLEATLWGFLVVLARSLPQLCPQIYLGQVTLPLWVSVHLSENQGVE